MGRPEENKDDGIDTGNKTGWDLKNTACKALSNLISSIKPPGRNLKPADPRKITGAG